MSNVHSNGPKAGFGLGPFEWTLNNGPKPGVYIQCNLYIPDPVQTGILSIP